MDPAVIAGIVVIVLVVLFLAFLLIQRRRRRGSLKVTSAPSDAPGSGEGT